MQTKLIVDGMSCSHCENAVKKALLAVKGITDARVDLAGKTVTVNHTDSVTHDTMKTAIEDQGFTVTV